MYFILLDEWMAYEQKYLPPTSDCCFTRRQTVSAILALPMFSSPSTNTLYVALKANLSCHNWSICCLFSGSLRLSLSISSTSARESPKWTLSSRHDSRDWAIFRRCSSLQTSSSWVGFIPTWCSNSSWVTPDIYDGADRQIEMRRDITCIGAWIWNTSAYFTETFLATVLPRVKRRSIRTLLCSLQMSDDAWTVKWVNQFDAWTVNCQKRRSKVDAGIMSHLS